MIKFNFGLGGGNAQNNTSANPTTGTAQDDNTSANPTSTATGDGAPIPTAPIPQPNTPTEDNRVLATEPAVSAVETPVPIEPVVETPAPVPPLESVAPITETPKEIPSVVGETPAAEVKSKDIQLNPFDAIPNTSDTAIETPSTSGAPIKTQPAEETKTEILPTSAENPFVNANTPTSTQTSQPAETIIVPEIPPTNIPDLIVTPPEIEDKSTTNTVDPEPQKITPPSRVQDFGDSIAAAKQAIENFKKEHENRIKDLGNQKQEIEKRINDEKESFINKTKQYTKQLKDIDELTRSLNGSHTNTKTNTNRPNQSRPNNNQANHKTPSQKR